MIMYESECLKLIWDVCVEIRSVYEGEGSHARFLHENVTRTNTPSILHVWR